MVGPRSRVGGRRPVDVVVAERAGSTAPTVSVALGTHNGARFVEAQLLSILEQSRPVDEIVVSDDASTDGTVELIERIVQERRAAGAPTPELVVRRNRIPLGVTANFEQALRASSGDFVALCDQDDVWHPDRIALALAASNARPSVELVAGEARLVDDAGEPLGSTLFGTLGVDAVLRRRLESDAAFDELLKRNVLTGATMLVARSLVERAAPFPSSWVHDEWLAMVASVGGGIAIVTEPIIDYRQHGGNQIGVTSLGLGGRIERLREPRTRRNARLLARAEDLAERLPTVARGDRGVKSVIDEKLAHEEARRALPKRRWGRVSPILREWRTGRYTRFGLGLQDVLRDLVQPD